MLEEVSADLLDRIYGPAGFDGIWSQQSRHLQASDAFRGQKLSLDRYWGETPQNYVCSICGRDKLQLAQLSMGSLSASLHCDHDHIGDLIQLKAKELDLLVDIRPIIELYSFYEPLIICKACNWIDSQVKKMLPKVHKFFSFPPKDKATLIKEFGKRRHKIDKKLALQKWKLREKQFTARLIGIERDLLDKLDSRQRYIGYNPKKKLFHGAFERFSQVEQASGLSLSFQDFLHVSIGVHSK